MNSKNTKEINEKMKDLLITAFQIGFMEGRHDKDYIKSLSKFIDGMSALK